VAAARVFGIKFSNFNYNLESQNLSEFTVNYELIFQVLKYSLRRILNKVKNTSMH